MFMYRRINVLPMHSRTFNASVRTEPPFWSCGCCLYAFSFSPEGTGDGRISLTMRVYDCLLDDQKLAHTYIARDCFLDVIIPGYA
jgi:hypothetical protein